CECVIWYGGGISGKGSLSDLGVEHGIVRKSGAWYTYDGTQLGQGKENARRFLRENVDMATEVERKIKEKLGIPSGDDSPSEEEKTTKTAKEPAKEPAKTPDRKSTRLNSS